jgi:hypothetical protein
MKVELEHRKDTKSVSLPGLEEDDEEEQKVEEQKLEPEPVDFMQFDDDKNETNDMDMFFEQRETNDSNDFFSEMVNTEDDPSVSEFLADMTE